MTPPCAICNPGPNPSSLRLCKACRADPANADWSEGDRLNPVPLHGDVEPSCWISDWQGSKAKEVPALLPKIVALLQQNVTVQRRPRGATRYRKEWDTVTRPPTLAEIARQLKVDRSTVRKCLNRYFNNRVTDLGTSNEY